jgi:hypothetical protein
VNEVVGRPA